MNYEFTFILPCLNEEKTLPFVIDEIKNAIGKNNLNAEILLADNENTDRSVEIAKEYGANVNICSEKGYGNTLRSATKVAQGKYCFMGDSDSSYDFTNIMPFVNAIRAGNDFVIGNRYKGGFEKGAMPISHYFGVKFLSAYANFFFKSPIKDYHCGLRCYDTQKINDLNLKQPGMEYATEMIAIAQINNLKLVEVPTKLRKDLRDRKPHLRTIRDGFRHLIYITKVGSNKSKYICCDDEKRGLKI